MKLLFIPAKSNAKVDFNNIKLDGRIGVVTTMQYLGQTKRLCNGKFIFGGQILGCNFSNAIKIKNKVDKYLYIGTGRFHALGLALNVDKDVYVLNPMSNEFYKINKREIDEHKKKRRGALLRFMNSEKIGLLVTLKLGQYNTGRYLGLKEKMKQAERIKSLYPKKKFYLFVFNTLAKEELENFNDVECWVNMACPRLVDDYERLINFEDVCRR